MRIIGLIVIAAAMLYIGAMVIKIGVIASEHQAELDAVAKAIGN